MTQSPLSQGFTIKPGKPGEAPWVVLDPDGNRLDQGCAHATYEEARTWLLSQVIVRCDAANS
jgi:hypothetical protein